MKPGGIMVINAVLLDNLEIALRSLKDMGMESVVIQIQIQKGRAMPWSRRFEALNPVWIITGKK
jgi:precorrin-6Y C5,15-methyltransferase (decarboxylating)